MNSMMEALGPATEEVIEAQLADEAAAERVRRIPAAESSRALAKAYPASTLRFDTPGPHVEADPLRVLAAVLHEQADFEVDPREAKELATYLKLHRSAVEKIMRFTPDTVAAEYAKPMPPGGRPPRDYAETVSRDLRRAAKQERDALPPRFAPTLLAILGRAEQAVGEVLRIEVERNQSFAESFGLPDEETNVLRGLKRAVRWLAERRQALELNPLNATPELVKALLPGLTA
jgi:hypothetical protein